MPDWTTFIHALLPHPNQPLVLARTSDSGKIVLPGTIHNGGIWVSETGTLKPILEALTGMPIHILRYVAYHRDVDAHQIHCIYLLEPRGAAPENTLWQPVSKILQDGDLPSALQEGLAGWEAEQSSGLTPQRRAPWARLGWHTEVEQWIEDQVRIHERGKILRIEPIKSWSISCVLQVTTESSILYFKVPRDLPLFVNEGVVLSRLADIYPDQVPVPVALEPAKGWMLLDDFGDPLGGEAPLDNQTELMRDFARLQLDSSQEIDRLLEAGCKDRRPEIFFPQIEPLLEDEYVLQALTLEERATLEQIRGQLRPLLDELFALPIPVALLHGDLHSGNVVRHKNQFLYFDWTDAAISHPFFDMIHIFMEEEAALRTSLQEAYLGIWEENFSKADVRRAWDLASALFGLYHAISYQHIVHGIEEIVQPELNFAYYFLRKLLEGMARLETE